MRFTCQILRKVRLKPLETLSTNVANMTVDIPVDCEEMKSSEKQTQVFDREQQ
jgi:hypothetical protein